MSLPFDKKLNDLATGKMLTAILSHPPDKNGLTAD